MSNSFGGTDLALIAQMGLESFKAALAPVRAFSVDFSDEAAAKCSTVSTRLVTGMSAGAFGGDYETGDTTLTAKTVTLDQHSFRAFHMTDVEASKTSVDIMATQVKEAAYAVGYAIWQYCTNLFVGATYGSTSATEHVCTAANFDADDVADIAKLGDDKNWPDRGRSLILMNSYVAALRKDNAIQDASALGSDQVIREGAIGRLLGFDVFRTNAFSSTLTGASEYTYGIAAVPDALAVAIRPVVPQDTSLVQFATATDPESGLTLGIRKWYAPKSGTYWGAVEALYGAAAANTNGIVRIVSQ